MLAIGMMSVPSCTGIDVALVETNGEDTPRLIASHQLIYTQAAQELIAHACTTAGGMDLRGSDPIIDEAAHVVTQLHLEAVRQLLHKAGVDRMTIEVIGAHGHTVAHRPDLGWTWQIGDGAVLADILNIQVVTDMSPADLHASGPDQAVSMAVMAVRRLRLLPVGLQSEVMDGALLWTGKIHTPPSAWDR
jgi:anhydro-N-acetylmuramic acid kinase